MSHIDFNVCCNGFFFKVHCDDLCSSVDRVTYFNNSPNQFSFIDHIFLRSSLCPAVHDILIVHSGAKFSDHQPLVNVLHGYKTEAGAY